MCLLPGHQHDHLRWILHDSGTRGYSGFSRVSVMAITAKQVPIPTRNLVNEPILTVFVTEKKKPNTLWLCFQVSFLQRCG